MSSNEGQSVPQLQPYMGTWLSSNMVKAMFNFAVDGKVERKLDKTMF